MTIQFPDYQIGYLYSLLPFYKLNTGISQSLKRMIVEIKITLSELCIDEEVRSKMFKSNLASLAYIYIFIYIVCIVILLLNILIHVQMMIIILQHSSKMKLIIE